MCPQQLVKCQLWPLIRLFITELFSPVRLSTFWSFNTMFWNVCCFQLPGCLKLSVVLRLFLLFSNSLLFCFSVVNKNTLEDLWGVRPCFSYLSIEAFQLVLPSSPCCPSLQIYISHTQHMYIIFSYICKVLFWQVFNIWSSVKKKFPIFILLTSPV